MSGRRKAWILASVAVLATLLLAETALDLAERSQRRSSRPGPAPFYPWTLNTSRGEPIGSWGFLQLAMHPFALYANLPNQATPFYSTDERGFRRNGKPPPDAPARRVVLVGGSAAFGTGLARDADSFAARLEERLEGTEVINAAVIGHLSGQELAYVVSDLVDLEPDLILVLDGWNDLVDQMTGPSRTLRTAGVNNAFFLIEDRMRRLYALESGGWWNRAVAAVPLVFQQLAERLAAVGSTGGDPRPPSPEDAPVGTLGRNPASLAAVYARNIRKLQLVAEAFGSRLLCVLQADRESFTPGEGAPLEAAYAEFRAEARKRLRDAGVAHVDLNESPEAFGRSRFMDRVHLDARGQDAMAEVVSAVIQRERLLAGGDAATGR